MAEKKELQTRKSSLAAAFHLILYQNPASRQGAKSRELTESEE